MTLPSDTGRRISRERGVSLFEMLVVLAILAIALATAASLTRRPPDRVELRGHAAELIDRAMAARLRALNEGRRIAFTPAPEEAFTVSDCAGPWTPPTLTFRPDGGAEGGPICLTLKTASIRVDADPLTGLLTMTEGRNHD